jgi:TRAP-type C4-dicarboxylate transport system permease small subunit
MSATTSESEPGPVRRLLDGLYLGAGWAAGLFLIAILVLMMGLSLGREIGVNIPAGDDFASWCMAAMAFLGLAHTFKSGDMIRVGLLLERLHGPARLAFEFAALAIALVAVGFFAWQAGQMTYDSWRFADMSQGVVAVPLWIPQSAVALGLGILSVAILDELVRVARGLPPSYEKPPPQSPDEFVERVAQGGGI